MDSERMLGNMQTATIMRHLTLIRRVPYHFYSPHQRKVRSKITNSKLNHAVADLRHHRVSAKEIHLQLLRILTKTNHVFFLRRFTLICHQVIENYRRYYWVILSNISAFSIWKTHIKKTKHGIYKIYPVPAGHCQHGVAKIYIDPYLLSTYQMNNYVFRRYPRSKQIRGNPHKYGSWWRGPYQVMSVIQ